MTVLLLAAFAFLYAAHAKTDFYGDFVRGAGEGLRNAARVTPYLAAALLLAEVLRASGLLEIAGQLLAPLFRLLGLPEGLLPLYIVRPLSGAAALSELETVIETYGPDSFEARAACCALGSSETVLYTCALYLGSVHVRSGRGILPIGLLSGAFGAILGVFLCKIL